MPADLMGYQVRAIQDAVDKLVDVGEAGNLTTNLKEIHTKFTALHESLEQHFQVSRISRFDESTPRDMYFCDSCAIQPYHSSHPLTLSQTEEAFIPTYRSLVTRDEVWHCVTMICIT